MFRACKRLADAGVLFWRAKRGFASWEKIPLGPKDPVFGLTETFLADTSDLKVNLGVGAYRDENGKPWILPSVRMARNSIHEKNLDKEYLDTQGDDNFCNATLELALGKDHPHIANKQVISVQTVSGTNSMSIAGTFLSRFYPGPKIIYLPTPTWNNHANVFRQADLTVRGYTYMDLKTYGLNIEGLLRDLDSLPERSIVLLHTCAQNPTGVDPTKEKWVEIAEVFKKKNLFPYFDMGCQGFASGDTDNDAFSLRHFIEQGIQCGWSTSFSRNMGLYGERVGSVSFTTGGKEESERILSQLKMIIAPRYLNPPITGMRIVREILNDEELLTQWKKDIYTMAQRLRDMRKGLKDSLLKEGSIKNWDHITKQIGLYSYTGLEPTQVESLIRDHHIYVSNDGRISIAGLSKANLPYVAQSMHNVTKNARDQDLRNLFEPLSTGDFRKILGLGLCSNCVVSISDWL